MGSRAWTLLSANTAGDGGPALIYDHQVTSHVTTEPMGATPLVPYTCTCAQPMTYLDGNGTDGDMSLVLDLLLPTRRFSPDSARIHWSLQMCMDPVRNIMYIFGGR